MSWTGPVNPVTDPAVIDQFNKDVKDEHLIYDYNVLNPDGSYEKWRYEMWFFSSDRIVYAIHGGPMAGRYNFQTAGYQCIQPGKLWQVNWLEETGSICSLVWDIEGNKLSTLIGFSRGHWEFPQAAHGDKRNPVDFERWRGLARVGIQTDRYLLNEQADIVCRFKGQGTLVPIKGDEPTL